MYRDENALELRRECNSEDFWLSSRPETEVHRAAPSAEVECRELWLIVLHFEFRLSFSLHLFPNRIGYRPLLCCAHHHDFDGRDLRSCRLVGRAFLR